MYSLLICGGGNGMHAVVPIAGRNSRCRLKVYTPFAREASLLNARLAQFGGFRATGAVQSARYSPHLITADPAEAGRDVDMVLLVLPAFAHGRILADLAPYLPDGVKVGAMPARSGFEYQAYRILAEKGPRNFVVFGLQTLPWACRVKEFGAEVEILGVKDGVGAAAIPRDVTNSLCDLLTGLFGLRIYSFANMLALGLANVGQIIHPGIMYGMFKNYNGEAFREEEIPLFYSGVDDAVAAVLQEMSDEVQLVKEQLQKRLGPEIDLSQVPTVRQWLLDAYPGQIEDKSTLAAAFRTNRAYKGLKVPVKKLAEDKFVPDFRSRYLTEDIPTGLLVTCSLARLAGVSTPVIDRVISLTSTWMGKEYLRDGSLAGKDIAEARIPQNYGITGFAALKELLVRGTVNRTAGGAGSANI